MKHDRELWFLEHLPFIGYHRPDFLRISDNKFKSAQDSGYQSPSTEEQEQNRLKRAALRLQKSQEAKVITVHNLVEKAKATALRDPQNRARREEASRRMQKEMLAKREKAEERWRIRVDLEAKKAIEKMTQPHRDPALSFAEKKERRRKTARAWAKMNRARMLPAGRTIPTPLRWTWADGVTLEFNSVRKCAAKTGRSYDYLKEIVRAHKTYTFRDGCNVEVIV